MSDVQELSDWDEVRCPLSVVRYEWDDDGNDGHPVLGVCGEPLYVHYIREEIVQRVGEQDLCGTYWRVECLGEHVLLVPDHAGDDNLDRIPFDRAVLDEVLSRLASTLANS